MSLSTSACIKITNTVLNNKSISLTSKVVNLSLTGKNSEFNDQITNYSKLLNLKVVTKKDSRVALLMQVIIKKQGWL